MFFLALVCFLIAFGAAIGFMTGWFHRKKGWLLALGALCAVTAFFLGLWVAGAFYLRYL